MSELMPEAPLASRPMLLPGSRGALFAVYYPPSDRMVARGDLLVVPAFGEEMNRCRQMVGLQARRLAVHGYGALVLDPFGTGDSAGEFVDATWAGWKDDLRVGIEWLRQHGHGCRTLWGIRLGAQMASELAATDSGIERLLLWQPVFGGKAFFTQFLRIRIAADLHLPDRIKTTNELRALFDAGQSVEVSGYEVGPRLASEIDGLTFDPAVLAGKQVDWFDVATNASAPPLPAAQKLRESMMKAGVRLSAAEVVGPPFWQVHEREVAPALLDAVCECASAWTAPKSVAPRAASSTPKLPAANETPMVFDCGPDRLVGVLHLPHGEPTCGAIIVIAGGPQYRAGAPRQFVQLARCLAAAGCAVLRFDQRGMGDSTGDYRGFEHIGEDIAASVDAIRLACPSLEQLTLIGECNSASDILFYAWRDRRITAAVLTNPWVRTPEVQAQVIVKRYYVERLRSREFWQHVLSGRFEARKSLSSLIDVLKDFRRGRRLLARARASEAEAFDSLPLPVRTAEGLRRFGRPALLLMSGHDYIAREFDEVTVLTPAWTGLIDGHLVRRVDIEGADHTFSKKVWKSAMTRTVVDWVMAQAQSRTESL